MSVVEVRGEGFRPYEVRIGPGLLASAGDLVRPFARGRVAVVSDDVVAPLHAAAVMQALSATGLTAELVVVPAGEASKSFRELERLMDRLLELGLDRSSLVVALGGGVIGDLAGLAAALFMRGIDFVQVPTTLLAQVDSSVGGKTAIDTPRGKNLVGVFHQPRLVIADVEVLATLPERQLRSGWAEVVKHGLLADADYFDWVAGEGLVGLSGDTAALEQVVRRSVEIKAEVVGEDQKEAGRRALLNLGHTFGHALEAELGFDETTLTHGEAVAIGCVLAFALAAEQGLCLAEDAARAEAAFAAAGLPTRLEAAGGFSARALVERMLGDKKAEGGGLTLVLAEGIGRAVVRKSVDPAAVEGFLKRQGAT